ncbi:uncharacterized protein LOC127546860 [Antechinus flavipes]|uniref:uncharacterized protein LOC127546860 n=1 Tax=Antechinus flavipes TaxID=38775 RepID=UPI002235866E|nr:uncharacterized protein LOC127546860 [Antechinus flavipes]
MECSMTFDKSTDISFLNYKIKKFDRMMGAMTRTGEALSKAKIKQGHRFETLAQAIRQVFSRKDKKKKLKDKVSDISEGCDIEGRASKHRTEKTASQLLGLIVFDRANGLPERSNTRLCSSVLSSWEGIMKRQLRTSLMLLWMQLFWARGQIKVDQSPEILILPEGANVSLQCKWSSAVNNLQWFKQNPGEGPVSLFFMASGMKQIGRFSSKMNSKDRHSSLHITDSQRGDSATYLCAVETQCSSGTCRLCTNTVAQAPNTVLPRDT